MLAGAVVRERLRATTVTAVRGRAYDVVAHQQAAMPEQLQCARAGHPEHEDQEQQPGRREVLDLTALWALGESRMEVEALDLSADRLPCLRAAFTKAGDDSRVRADRYTGQDDVTAAVRPNGRQAHRPQEAEPRRGREAGH
ncbi:hypothetical protein [Streptomyces griseofuscus]|uniref:hypothetical protein n=1 Tax=Streptomyces griseofuscus TaxID=146922 RepID=UPI0038049FE8